MKTGKKNIFLKSREALRSLATRRISMICDAIPYAFENVPLKKVINWLKVETSLLGKPDRPWGWPTHLQVEPSNRCNLRCVLCPLSGEMQRSQGQRRYSHPCAFQSMQEPVECAGHPLGWQGLSLHV